MKQKLYSFFLLGYCLEAAVGKLIPKVLILSITKPPLKFQAAFCRK